MYYSNYRLICRNITPLFPQSSLPLFSHSVSLALDTPMTVYQATVSSGGERSGGGGGRTVLGMLLP